MGRVRAYTSSPGSSIYMFTNREYHLAGVTRLSRKAPANAPARTAGGDHSSAGAGAAAEVFK